ncbi:MAG: hypothetical protein GXZ07_10410 [Firmicutes bacterium]|nr:hypothetical protein [Bacillota bacterium]
MTKEKLEKRAKKILIILLCIPIVAFVSCKILLDTEENPQAWMKDNTRVAFTSIYGDSPHKNYVTSVLETKDGGYILAGYTYTGEHLESDGWLIKCDHAGKEVWSRTFDAGLGDRFNAVRQTRDGGYILAGCTGTKDASGFPCIEDGCVVKTDSQGKETWSSTFGGKNPDEFNSVQQTADGGYVPF